MLETETVNRVHNNQTRMLKGSIKGHKTVYKVQRNENAEGFNRRSVLSTGFKEKTMLKGTNMSKRFNFDFFLFKTTTVFNENRCKCYST